MKKILAFLFFNFLGFSGIYACSCDSLSFEEATEWADEIFIGRLIQIKEVNTYEQDDGQKATRVWSALFEVEKKWKGSNEKYVEVFQPNTSCDFFFELSNEPYIVYAKNDDLFNYEPQKSFKALTTYLCSRTANDYIYNNMGSFGFDDREKLDKKYPHPIVLSGSLVSWRFLLFGILVFLFGLILGVILKR